MKQKLLLNGMEVVASFLTQWTHRAASCDFLLPVTSKNQQQALAAYRRDQEKEDVLCGLRVSGIADLSFLHEFPDIRYLEILGQKRVNVQPLEALSNLRGLRLETPGSGLDFSCLPLLEVFVGDWHADNRGIAQARELWQLRTWQFKPGAADLSVLAGAPRLEVLQLTQTNITSLAGVESLEDLRMLDIAYAAKLESLDALASPSNQLRELAISNAKKIPTYRPLASCEYLRRLRLSACAPMPDLKWTAGMNRLETFTFVETNVEDGDLSPLLDLPELRWVGTMDKRHYNYKSNDLSDLLQKRFEGPSAG